MITLRSFLTIHVLKQVIYALRQGRSIRSTNFYKGFRLYLDTKKHVECKSIIKVLAETSFLTRYWEAYPDAYFRFGMFSKGYTDKKKMLSFIPQEAYARKCMHDDKTYNILIDDKILFHDILSYYGIPVPERYFVYRNGEFRKGAKLLSEFEVNEIISNITDEKIFVKKFTGGAASGISVFLKDENGKYLDSDGDVVDAYLIRTKFKNQDFIFEKQIIQEPVLSQFNPDTVNTIRVLTFNKKIISATVRFGGKGEFVDNVSANGVAVSLDIESGMLGDYGMKMYSTIEHFYEHPDSHLRFKNTIVTQWQEVRRIVEKTMHYLPYFNSVGFDVATTENGPVIIEINTGAGINLSQMGKEYGLKTLFEL